ncbi:MAG: hypothetical protein Q7R95_04120 [bacterium]|nr:hypothetical protein [bacterium]
MNNLQLQEYVRKSIASGFSMDQIRQKLLAVGWQQSVIEPYLINQDSSVSQVFQPTPTTNPTVTNTTEVKTIAESGKPKMSVIKKAAFILLGIGVVLIVTFMALTFIGKSVFISPKNNFSQKDIQNEQNLDLTTADNPYRIFLYARYAVKGKPFGISNKLFDYNISIADNQGSQIATSNGTYKYHKTSSSSDSQTSLSVQNSNITLSMKDFRIEKNGNYKIIAKLAVPESLDSNFTLSDWNYEIKGKVLTPPPLLVISGFIMLVVSFILFLISRKKSYSVV